MYYVSSKTKYDSNFSLQVKTFMILIYLNVISKLMVRLVVSNLSMWAEAHPEDTFHPLGNPLLP